MSTEVRQTIAFFSSLTTLTLPSSLVVTTTVIAACFRVQFPSKMAFHADNPREMIPRKKINIHVLKYAIEVLGAHEAENIASMMPV